MIASDWKYILESQPEQGRVYIILRGPYEAFPNADYKKRWLMSYRIQDMEIPWEEYFRINKENNLPLPDYWWVYATDFPFPLLKED